MSLVRTKSTRTRKIATVGLSKSEREFFSTAQDGPERSLRKGYFKSLDRKKFGH